MRKYSELSLFILIFSLVSHVTVGILYTITVNGDELGLITIVVVLSLSAGFILGEYFVDTKVKFRIILAVHLLILLISQYFLSFNIISELLIFTSILAGVSIYEEYPTNVFFTSGITLLYLLVRFSRFLVDNYPNFDGFTQILFESLGIVGLFLIVSLMISRLIYYRERLIDTADYSNRLEHAIGSLARANTEYQDYLIKIEAESSEKERKRITRDIHDIVGYTLTNNIMLMEAATDMVRMNPLGITKLLNTARGNAQEGLEQIRESLYSYRREKDFVPYGLHAINKLIKTYELATRITVDTSYGNMPWTVTTEIDAIIYHIIQESMVNSLRHGRATNVRVLMGINHGFIQVNVSDNGIGADETQGEIKPGIGLKGMQERLQSVEGSLKYYNTPGGFEVDASIPYTTPINEEK
jgi:signal transduction histidine kinase